MLASLPLPVVAPWELTYNDGAPGILLEQSLLVHTSGIVRGSHALTHMPMTFVGGAGRGSSCSLPQAVG